MQTASFTYGENFSLFSMYLGANIVPSASRLRSFARSMIFRCPAASRQPASPERIQPPPRGRAPAAQPRALEILRDVEKEAHEAAFGPRAVLDAHHHVGEQSLPDARRCEEVGRSDLAEIRQHGGRALRTVDGERYENCL